MTVAPATRSSRLARWAFVPFVLLALAGLFAAAGFQFTPESKAVNTTTVGVTVLGAVSLSGDCTTNGTLSGANFLPTATGAQTLGSCTLTQGTTNGSPSVTRVESTRATAGTGIFCQTTLTPDTTACAGAAATNFTQATAGSASLADGQFGVQVASLGTCVGGSSWVNSMYYPLRDAATAGAGDTVCTTAGATATTSTTLSFQADPITTQTAGAYSTKASFTVASS